MNNVQKTLKGGIQSEEWKADLEQLRQIQEILNYAKSGDEQGLADALQKYISSFQPQSLQAAADAMGNIVENGQQALKTTEQQTEAERG